MANILIVDDELGIRNVLSEILMEAGHQVSAAEDAVAALAQISKKTFDLVLLDIWMPGMDGLKLLQKLKAEQQLTFPVIMMSGHATIESAMQAVQIGAVDFLEKPIALKKLMMAVDGASKKWRERTWAERQESARQAFEETRQSRSKTSKRKPAAPQGKLPVFTIPEYNLTLDFNQPYREQLLAFERAYFLTTLAHVRHSFADLSRHTCLERTHLYRKVKQLGIDVDEARAAAARAQSEVGADTSGTAKK